MKYSIPATLLLLTLSLLAIGDKFSPVHAQSQCGTIQNIAPSSESREIKLGNTGIAFNIPANYRVASRKVQRGLSIDIYSPSEYEFLECVKRNNIRTEIDSTATVQIIPIGGRYQTPEEFAASGWVYNLDRVVSRTTIAGQPAIVYGTRRRGFTTVLVLSPDKKYAVTFTEVNDNNEPIAKRTFNQVLASFRFNAESASNSVSSSQQPQNSSTQVAPTLRPIISQIRSQLPRGLVMRLPSEIEGVAYDGRKFPVYGIVQEPYDDQFRIQLAATPDCDVRACLVGYIGVAPLGSRSLPTRGEKNEPINVTPNIRGTYIYRTFPGAASSGPINVIVWEQNGVVYTVSSGMSKEKVLKIASSMATGVTITSQQ